MPKKNTTSSTTTKPRAKTRSKKTTAKASTPGATKTPRRKTPQKEALTPLSAVNSIVPLPVSVVPAIVPVHAPLATPRVHVHALHPEARLLLIGEYYLVIVLCAIIGIGCMYAILAWL